MSVTSRHGNSVDSSLSRPRPVVPFVDRRAIFLLFTLFSLSLACQHCSFQCSDSASLEAHEADFHLCKVRFAESNFEKMFLAGLRLEIQRAGELITAQEEPCQGRVGKSGN